jgi:hypothetical protein
MQSLRKLYRPISFRNKDHCLQNDVKWCCSCVQQKLYLLVALIN